ncbi:hypothetical protein Gpo141_00005777 [Globisporangium polare]
MKRTWSSQLVQYLQLLALVLFYTLDVRDLSSKLVWLGPPDTFAFTAVSTSAVSHTPLIPTVDISTLVPGEEFPVENNPNGSAWLSFYEKCEQLHAGDAIFSTFVGKNCRLGNFGSFLMASDVIFSASVRVDSVAWASCKMLSLHRRPPICQESLVADFPRRYHLQDVDVRGDAMAAINSDAEYELLRMLDMLSRAYPLDKVVCTEGFQYGGPGQYSATLFTCASPSFYESAIVGHHAHNFGQVHDGLSWLAVDKVTLLGFNFVVRQNSRSMFELQHSSAASATIAQRSQVNFSSFGHLYVVMVLIDLALFAAQARSLMEVASVLGFPVVSQWCGDSDGLNADFSWTVLYRSLYRSKSIAVLTIISAVLSWITMLPNAAISGWDVDSGGRTHAFFTSMRAWMLVTALLNLCWDLVVALSETRAYNVARSTFVSIPELMALVASVCFFERAIVFDIASKKHKLEGQRSWDVHAFKGQTGFFNSYNAALELDAGTPTSSLRALYDPLVLIVLESFLVVGVYLTLKAMYLGHQKRAPLATSEYKHAADIQVIESTDDLDLSSPTSESQASLIDLTDVVYSRLPLEEQLELPIRARSLVRNCFELEQVVANQLCIHPPVYFAVGLVVKNGLIRTRRGFLNVIHPEVDMVAQDGTHYADSGSPSKSTIPSAKIAAVTSMVLATDAPGGASGGAAPGGGKSDASGAVPGRRPLAETGDSVGAHSMRRRKSTNEFTLITL